MDSPSSSEVSRETRRRQETVVDLERRSLDTDDLDGDARESQLRQIVGRGERTGIDPNPTERALERHAGEMWVDSEPGEEATISFTVPAVGDHHE